MSVRPRFTASAWLDRLKPLVTQLWQYMWATRSRSSVRVGNVAHRSSPPTMASVVMVRQHFSHAPQFTSDSDRQHTWRCRRARSDSATTHTLSTRLYVPPSCTNRKRWVENNGSLTGCEPQPALEYGYSRAD